MAERRHSAHAGDDQNNGGWVSAKNHVTGYPVIYIDQCTSGVNLVISSMEELKIQDEQIVS